MDKMKEYLRKIDYDLCTSALDFWYMYEGNVRIFLNKERSFKEHGLRQRGDTFNIDCAIPKQGKFLF